MLEVLKTEGYIRGFSVTEREGRSELDIELKYFEGEPVIREIERISKPGRRVYTSVKNLPRINNGLGVAIVSTPKGVMADHAARDANVGGEISSRYSRVCPVSAKSSPVPSGITADVEGQTVKVKGPKGALSIVLPDDVAG